MTEEQIELGRRAVACKGWRWMPGMRAVGQYPNYPVRVHECGENVRDTDDMEEPEPWGWQQPAPYSDHVYPGPYLPDLTDHATLGCLLALVREAWGDLHMVARCDDRHGKVSWWICRWGDLPRSRECSTEAEALVAALEAAP
jgi:hypothetical protein